MINGFSTLGAVALRIIADYNETGIRHASRYTLDQAIEKVCFRRETVSSEGSSPSYVWAIITLDGGEAMIEYDRGKLVGVPLGERKYRYISLLEDFDEGSIMDDYSNEIGVEQIDDFMFRSGLTFGQRFLFRYRIIWSKDYYGESECDTEYEIIYVEPVGCQSSYLRVTHDLATINPFKGLKID